MTRALLTLCLLSTGCGTEPCALTAEDVEPAPDAKPCGASNSSTTPRATSLDPRPRRKKAHPCKGWAYAVRGWAVLLWTGSTVR